MDAFIKVDTIPGRIIKKIPFPGWVVYVLFWGLLYAVDTLLSSSFAFTENLTEFGILMFYCVLCICLDYNIRLLIRLFPDLQLITESSNMNMNSWYVVRLKFMFQGWGPIISALLLAVAVELSVGQTINALQVNNPALMYFRMGYRVVGFSILGMSLWSLVQVMRLPQQLLRLEKRIQLTHVASLGLQSLGTTFFRLALAATACYIVLIGIISISELRNNLIVLGWATLGSLIIFCFFLLPQLGIHKIMVQEKRQRLISFSRHLDQAIAQSLFEPSIENTQRVKELYELQRHLQEMNDWPFNTQTLWQLISALLIPVLLIVIQLLFDVRA